ncbi:MAG: GNAT family N-acetyltransferase [Anaerolineae bacterium]
MLKFPMQADLWPGPSGLEGRFRKREPSAVVVRPAELADLNACCEIDGAYVTDYVWQMQVRERDGSIDIKFDTIRLPRQMKVPYPRHPDELWPHWQQEACFLVAAQDDQIVGYLDACPDPGDNVLWIYNLVIARTARRRGVATELLQAAGHWAKQRGQRRFMLELQTKNYPAICFAHKHGFAFCGYNDRYFANGDIALFFSLPV